MKKALLSCGGSCCEKLSAVAHLKREKNADFIVFPINDLVRLFRKGSNTPRKLLEVIKRANFDAKELTMVVGEDCRFAGSDIFERMPELLSLISGEFPDFQVRGILIRKNEEGGNTLVNFYPKQ